MLEACPAIRGMRDPTRGGLSSALNELAAGSQVGVRISEKTIPVRPEVRAACEMLGLDPLCAASEGRLIAVVPQADARIVQASLRLHGERIDIRTVLNRRMMRHRSVVLPHRHGTVNHRAMIHARHRS